MLPIKLWRDALPQHFHFAVTVGALLDLVSTDFHHKSPVCTIQWKTEVK